MQIKYGAFESYPVRFTDTEAWAYMFGKWLKQDIAEVTTAQVLNEEAYTKAYGQLPPLPKAAFSGDPWSR
jgi:hypothetical protein